MSAFVTLVGPLVDDVALTGTDPDWAKGGESVNQATFHVAVTGDDDTAIRVVCFNGLAKRCAEVLCRGAEVVVTGFIANKVGFGPVTVRAQHIGLDLRRLP